MNDTLQRLTRANPMPPTTPLPEGIVSGAALRSVIDDRRGHVKTIHPPTETEKTPPRKAWKPLSAVVAFVVVALVIGITVFTRPDAGPVASDGDQPSIDDVATPVRPLPDVAPSALIGATPLEVAEAYLERLAAGDLTGAVSLFSSEFRSSQRSGFIDADGLIAALAEDWAVYHLTLDGTIEYDCVESGPSGVTCQVVTTDALSRRLGIADGVHEWAFEVEAGLIDSGALFPTASTEGLGESRLSEYGAVMSEYDAWGRNNHLDEFLASCREVDGTVPSWSASCALFRFVHLEEFAELENN